jgi:hypothetical protein
MTSSTQKPVAPNGALAAAAGGTPADRSIRHAAITAGTGLLVMSVLGGLATFVALNGLVTPGDAAQTATDISESADLFRTGIASLFVVIALDVVVACGLYRVFSPVSRSISMLAAAFRLVYAGVYLAAAGELLGVLRLLGDDDYLSVIDAEQLHAQALLGVTAFNDLWMLGLGLFGLHLLLEGYLAYRSAGVPRLLGVLIAVAGLGYLIDTFGVALSAGTWTPVAMFTFVGEFLLALWLVIRGGRLTASGIATTR